MTRNTPTNLQLQISATLFQVAWQFEEDPTDLPRWFRLEYASEGRFPFIAYSPHLPPTARLADVSAVLPGFVYSFRLRAEWPDGTPLVSEFSNVVSGSPGGSTPSGPTPPTDLVVQGMSNSRLRFRFTPTDLVNDTHFALIVYDADLGGPIEGTLRILTVIGAGTRVADFTGLPAASLFACQIAEGNVAEGFSAASPFTDVVATLPIDFELTKPDQVYVTPGAGTALVGWLDFQFEQVVQYRIERKLASNPSWVGATVVLQPVIAPSFAQAKELTGVAAGVWDVRVRAEADDLISAWTETQFTQPGGGGSPPAQPQNLVLDLADNVVSLSCDPVVGATSYVFTVTGDADASVPTELPATSLSLPYGGSYSVSVVAFDGDGNASPASDAINFAIPALPGEPAALTLLTAVGGDGKVTLTWDLNGQEVDYLEAHVTRTSPKHGTEIVTYAITTPEALTAVLLRMPYSASVSVTLRGFFNGIGGDESNALTATTNAEPVPVREMMLRNVVATLQAIDGTYPYHTKMLDVRRVYEPGVNAKVRPCCYVLEPLGNAATLAPPNRTSDHQTEEDLDLPLQIWIDGTGEDRALLISNAISDVQTAMARDVTRGGWALCTYYQAALAVDMNDQTGSVCVAVTFTVKIRFAAKDPTRRV